MPIKEHPVTGTVLLCDFEAGFKEPEMTKRRPVVVLSPKIAARPNLCTVVSLSTTPPAPILAYHCKIEVPGLPAPWDGRETWVKGDMIYAVGFHRLDFFRLGKDARGKRQYLYKPLSNEAISEIRACVLKGLGLSLLTKHL